MIWRDAGFWTQFLLRLSINWTAWLRRVGIKRPYFKELPPPGFVGQGSGSLAATDPGLFRPRSIRMRRLPKRASISGAPLWRLTCVLETPPLPLPTRRSGPTWEAYGSRWGGDGEEDLTPPTGTTLT